MRTMLLSMALLFSTAATLEAQHPGPDTSVFYRWPIEDARERERQDLELERQRLEIQARRLEIERAKNASRPATQPQVTPVSPPGAPDSSATKPAVFPRMATIGEVLKTCEPPKDPADVAAMGNFVLCAGYVNGLLDLISFLSDREAWEANGLPTPFHLCLPAEGVTGLTALSALRVYGAADAKRLDERAYLSLAQALRQAFPCKSD